MPVLYSFLGPFLVWPLEIFSPYPYLVEEIFKASVVWFGPKNLKLYFVSGIAFAFSETVLYTMNSYFSPTRLLITSLLHSTTFLIIYISTIKDRRLIFIGLIISIFVHYVYNSFLAGILS